LDNDGMDVIGKPAKSTARTSIGLYSSFTTRGGNNVLWHCDRKFFLVGKRITDAFLADLDVPE
jgi:hypothetical protein